SHRRRLHRNRAPPCARLQLPGLASMRWIVGFGRFWYHFIIVADWTVAVAIAVALVSTAVLVSAHVNAWWLTPVVVVAMLGGSLRRARRRDLPSAGTHA